MRVCARLLVCISEKICVKYCSHAHKITALVSCPNQSQNTPGDIESVTSSFVIERTIANSDAGAKRKRVYRRHRGKKSWDAHDVNHPHYNTCTNALLFMCNHGV